MKYFSIFIIFLFSIFAFMACSSENKALSEKDRDLEFDEKMRQGALNDFSELSLKKLENYSEKEIAEFLKVQLQHSIPNNFSDYKYSEHEIKILRDNNFPLILEELTTFEITILEKKRKPYIYDQFIIIRRIYMYSFTEWVLVYDSIQEWGAGLPNKKYELLYFDDILADEIIPVSEYFEHWQYWKKEYEFKRITSSAYLGLNSHINTYYIDPDMKCMVHDIIIPDRIPQENCKFMKTKVDVELTSDTNFRIINDTYQKKDVLDDIINERNEYRFSIESNDWETTSTIKRYINGKLQ